MVPRNRGISSMFFLVFFIIVAFAFLDDRVQHEVSFSVEHS